MVRKTACPFASKEPSFPVDALGSVRDTLVDLVALVDKDMHFGVDRDLLLSRAGDLGNCVEALWSNVEQGNVNVQSVAVLRALRDISCRDLRCELKEPSLKHGRILQQLRLLTNVMDYVIVPQSKAEFDQLASMNRQRHRTSG